MRENTQGVRLAGEREKAGYNQHRDCIGSCENLSSDKQGGVKGETEDRTLGSPIEISIRGGEETEL